MKRLAACFILLAIAAWAEDYAPLPKRILAAKTVYILNETGHPHPLDVAYQELKKWGRYVIVDDREKADLIFVLTQVRTGEETTVTRYGNDTITTRTPTCLGGKPPPCFGSTETVSTSTIRRAPESTETSATGFTTLSIFDPKTPEAPAIWRIQRDWGPWGAAKHASRNCVNASSNRRSNRRRRQASGRLCLTTHALTSRRNPLREPRTHLPAQRHRLQRLALGPVGDLTGCLHVTTHGSLH